MENVSILYRHEIVYPFCEEGEVLENPDPGIELVEYPIIKTTKCGFWINVNIPGVYTSTISTKNKWVSNNSKKRFAYPTIKESLNYFIHRKLSYVGYMNHAVMMNNKAINLAKEQYYKL